MKPIIIIIISIPLIFLTMDSALKLHEEILKLRGVMKKKTAYSWSESRRIYFYFSHLMAAIRQPSLYMAIPYIVILSNILTCHPDPKRYPPFLSSAQPVLISRSCTTTPHIRNGYRSRDRRRQYEIRRWEIAWRQTWTWFLLGPVTGPYTSAQISFQTPHYLFRSTVDPKSTSSNLFPTSSPSTQMRLLPMVQLSWLQ
jgi:hypothetical protein